MIKAPTVKESKGKFKIHTIHEDHL